MNIAETIAKIAADARTASFTMARLSTAVKNSLLESMAKALIDNTAALIDENRRDLEGGGEKGSLRSHARPADAQRDPN